MKGLTFAVVPPRREFLRLRKERPGPCAHDHSIAAIDEAIGIHIGAEVGRVRRLTGAVARLQVSPAFTTASALVSPRRTLIGKTTLPVLVPSLTLLKRNGDCLSVGHASEIDGDLRPAHAETAYAPDTRGYGRAVGRDWRREVNVHLISRAVAAFDSHIAGKWQREIKRARAAVNLSRERAQRHRSRWEFETADTRAPGGRAVALIVFVRVPKGGVIHWINR